MSKIRTENTVREFNKKLAKVFALYGVEKDSKDPDEFSLKTPFGTLEIYLHNEPDRGTLWTIFMRFGSDWKREELIKQLMGDVALNTHSGKWNIHQSQSDDAIVMFDHRMSKLGIEPKK